MNSPTNAAFDPAEGQYAAAMLQSYKKICLNKEIQSMADGSEQSSPLSPNLNHIENSRALKETL